MMKKLLAIVLCFALLAAATGCSVADVQVEETTEVIQETQPVEIFTEEVTAKLDGILKQSKFTGIVQLTHNGKVVYSSVSGENDLGEPLTMESPMYICSISKQFCAASVLILRDQGKLDLNDTLDTYFPEFEAGKDITLKQMLNMTSGLPRDCQPMFDDPAAYAGQTTEEMMAAFREWVFAQPLAFEPGTKPDYCNVNYILLSQIVENVSGQTYQDFLRQNVLEPLGMKHTAFVSDVANNTELTKGLTYEYLDDAAELPGVAQGAGDIVTTAADMDIWMTALKNGQVICKESFQEMTTMVNGYGYGLMAGLRGGFTHTGGAPTYYSYMYFNEEYGYNLYVASCHLNNYTAETPFRTAEAILGAVFTATDAAQGN